MQSNSSRKCLNPGTNCCAVFCPSIHKKSLSTIEQQDRMSTHDSASVTFRSNINLFVVYQTARLSIIQSTNDSFPIGHKNGCEKEYPTTLLKRSRTAARLPSFTIPYAGLAWADLKPGWASHFIIIIMKQLSLNITQTNTTIKVSLLYPHLTSLLNNIFCPKETVPETLRALLSQYKIVSISCVCASTERVNRRATAARSAVSLKLFVADYPARWSMIDLKKQMKNGKKFTIEKEVKRVNTNVIAIDDFETKTYTYF